VLHTFLHLGIRDENLLLWQFAFLHAIYRLLGCQGQFPPQSAGMSIYPALIQAAIAYFSLRPGMAVDKMLLPEQKLTNCGKVLRI